MRANIFDIKRFGINDGNGIRTVLFIKGCPLSCKWCHNPEGLSSKIHIWSANAACIHCKSCIKTCPNGALREENDAIRIDNDSCNLCGTCVRECPTNSLKPDAVSMSMDEAMSQILRDEPFYGEAGGVTLSGGECTASPTFSLKLLEACGERGIHTAIETSMYTSQENMKNFAYRCDSIIADIKLIDSKKHIEATGVDNAIILENFEYLAKNCKDLLIRIPLIPRYTDGYENIDGIAKFVAQINREITIELINFNPMCVGKYESMGKDFVSNSSAKPFSRGRMFEFAQIIKTYGLDVTF